MSRNCAGLHMLALVGVAVVVDPAATVVVVFGLTMFALRRPFALRTKRRARDRAPLELHDVTYRYGDVVALRGISLAIEPGRSSAWPGRRAGSSRRSPR